MKNIICILILLGSWVQGYSQTVTGLVLNAAGESLPGATVQWLGAPFGTATADDGSFIIEKIPAYDQLVISFVGYTPDTIQYTPELAMPLRVELMESGLLETVEVTGGQKDTYVSMLENANVQVMGKQEFRKAACCNLAESFENNASVDLMTSNAVLGSKEIEMLGLRGLYTQFLLEGRPVATGINGADVMGVYAGTWLEQLKVAKGATTISQGYQPIAGSINAELFKPAESPRVLINLYGASSGRLESNLHLNQKFNERWSGGMALHASTLQTRWDTNEDGFLDLPLREKYAAIFRAFYRGVDVNAQWNVLVEKETIEAGQRMKEPELSRRYLVDMDREHVELFGKVGYIGFDNPNTSLGFIYSLGYHGLTANLGERDYEGSQYSGYANLMYLNHSADNWHEWRAGLSFQYEDASEMFFGFNRPIKEVVPGAYLEYSYAPKVLPCDLEQKDEKSGRIGASAGIRVDHHNLFGWLVTPKANLKYFVGDNSVVRLSGGLGYRTPYVIAENIGALISNRALQVDDNIGIEKAWNAGINFTQQFPNIWESASLSLDLYRTSFQSQAVVDMDTDASVLSIYSLDGQSYANNALLLWSTEPIKGMNFKAAYKWTDTRVTINGDLLRRPFVPEHRALVAVDYETPSKLWLFNATCQWIGEQRLAHFHGVDPAELQGFPEVAPSYFLVFTHVEYAPGKWQYYAGVENLLDFRQKNAIIGAADPYNGLFDAGQVYAPVFGRNAYVGVRIRID
jgi:outer membrane receptor for ferrienterochelin and colicins